jgi:hypothetical protein
MRPRVAGPLAVCRDAAGRQAPGEDEAASLGAASREQLVPVISLWDRPKGVTLRATCDKFWSATFGYLGAGALSRDAGTRPPIEAGIAVVRFGMVSPPP